MGMVAEELKTIAVGLLTMTLLATLLLGMVWVMNTSWGPWVLGAVFALGFSWVLGMLIRFDPGAGIGD